jgi:multiple sugar transport system substrate-binding protein
MRFFAAQGLATPIDDVWNKVKGNFTGAFAQSVKGDDGHVYGMYLLRVMRNMTA